MKYRLICFDLDGTLVDSEHDIAAALRIALAATAGDGARDEEVIASAGLGYPLHEFFALARPTLPQSDLAPFVDAYRAHYHANLLEHTKPFPGVVETLAALAPLRANGLRTTVATTKKTDTARRVVEGLGLASYFDAVLGTDGIPHKPEPDLLHLAARTVDRAGEPALMVGDTERDIVAGKRAGMTTCGVGYGVTGRAALSKAQPDHLVDQFAELLALI